MPRLLLLLSLLAVPAFAQDQSEWHFEQGNTKRAPSLVRNSGDNLAFGFSCWQKRWTFYFTYQAPEGGWCNDQPSCEKDVDKVELSLHINGRPSSKARFHLFENFYFQDSALAPEDMKALRSLDSFKVVLDTQLKSLWQRDELAFNMAGLSAALDAEPKRFDCVFDSADLPKPAPVKIEKKLSKKEQQKLAAKQKKDAGRQKGRGKSVVKPAKGKPTKATPGKTRGRRS